MCVLLFVCTSCGDVIREQNSALPEKNTPLPKSKKATPDLDKKSDSLPAQPTNEEKKKKKKASDTLKPVFAMP